MDSIGTMYELFMDDKVSKSDLDDLVWTYQEANQFFTSTQYFVTIVKDIKSKSGGLIKAHLTKNGTFIRKAKDGEGPIPYRGNHRISRHTFDYNIYSSNGRWYLEFIKL